MASARKASTWSRPLTVPQQRWKTHIVKEPHICTSTAMRIARTRAAPRTHRAVVITSPPFVSLTRPHSYTHGASTYQHRVSRLSGFNLCEAVHEIADGY